MATLQAPKSGRSRFSKALPAPPPELDDARPRTAARDPPSLLYSPFPPRKDSVSVKTNTNTSPSIKSDLINSPLPALPPSNNMGSTVLQTQTRSIPRKPVGLPSNPTPAADGKSKKMKRVSSISSLLSAYSNTSSDSVQRSSQGSIFTKDSEPSNSPEREGINDGQQLLLKTLPVLPSNPYVDEMPSVTDEIIAADLPPPPPLKGLDRPSTPPSSRPVLRDPFSASQPGAHDVDSSSPSRLVGDSPQGREIWRRRASSKSDRSLVVPQLKLADSHGSTASTSQPPNIDLLPPPPPAQNTNTTSPLPPRSASLPGRNIRPVKQPDPQQEGEMRKLSAKLKELTGRNERAKGSDNTDGPKDEPIKLDVAVKGSESQAQPESRANTNPVALVQDQPVEENSPKESKASLETVVHAPSPAASSSEPPPKESAQKSISRRAVGSPSANPQPEVHKKGSSSDLRKQGLGLPRFPRPSHSNPNLRSPAVPHNVQETVRPRVGPQPQPTPPVVMPLTLPADSNEPMKKPELFNVVTALNEPTLSPTPPSSNRKPGRKVSKDIEATTLDDIGESMENMTPEHAEQVNAALSRFPRNLSQVAPTADTIWPAAPISSRHYNCYVHHSKWVPVKNLNYPLACQTCGLQDTSPRKTCSWCNLRICFKCHERLTGPYKSNLQTLMQNMEADQLEEKRREKGKQAETT
ncbi:hypothetical protein F5Y06DRAFT_199105 [Hypoxylon sp. FL0890]|nr:hypothetical protein F5Y06DRAFT_199105 [Hypoxylon sp. FL0890]